MDPAMTPSELGQYLHDHIPLSKAMAVFVMSVKDDEVILQAPLAPNINHRETVFGGSASALAILSAWSLLHLRMRSAGVECRLVIQRNTMEYEQPILGDFTAHATLAEVASWNSFVRMLDRKGKARIAISSVLHQADQRVGKFTGEFVALVDTAS